MKVRGTLWTKPLEFPGVKTRKKKLAFEDNKGQHLK